MRFPRLFAPWAPRVRSPRWVPRHRRLPPSGFRNLSAVCSPGRCAGLFHPAGTSRLRPSGGFPRQEPRRLVAAALPSCGYRGRASSCETTLPKLRFRALLPWRVRRIRSAVKRPGARSPLGLFPLQGLLRLDRRTVLPRSSPHELAAPRVRDAGPRSSGYCPIEGWAVSRETTSPLEVSGPFRSLTRSSATASRAHGFTSGARAASPPHRPSL
jgi:hypothetical protein